MKKLAAPNTAANTTSSCRFPGWYDDPDQPGLERFWNGIAWTTHSRPPQSTHQPDQLPDNGQSAELPASLLGPIDPSLQSLLDSFEHDHSLGARLERFEETRLPQSQPLTAGPR